MRRTLRGDGLNQELFECCSCEAFLWQL